MKFLLIHITSLCKQKNEIKIIKYKIIKFAQA